MTAPQRPTPRKGILDIAAYVPGKSSAAGVARVFKLSSNESPLGASPKAIEAYKSAAGSLELYPDGEATALRTAIGSLYGIDPARIICGAGSDELLSLIAHAYLGPGDEGLFTEHGFLVYRIATLAAGGTPVVAKETDLTVNVDALLKAVTPRTRVVFIANPANPTGTYLPFNEVKRLQAGLPKNVLLVLDAAYAEYVRRNDYEAGLELVASCENVVMCRTFSKIYGLAGVRLGWMVGPAPVIDAINRIRGPFNMNAGAIAAGIAAVNDQAHVEAARGHNDRWLPWLSEQLGALGIGIVPSVTNFVLLKFPATRGKTAADANEFLMQRGLILRMVGAYGLGEYLRVTISTEEANRLLVDALTEFMAR